VFHYYRHVTSTRPERQCEPIYPKRHLPDGEYFKTSLLHQAENPSYFMVD
jgi:hypothetical protein